MKSASFDWADAWVFASLHGATDDARQIDFSRLVAVADMLNHAIVSADEVRRALAKLHASGLVEVRDCGATITALAATLHEKIALMRGGAFSVVDNILRVLNSPRTRLAVVDAAPDTAFVTDDLVERAYERYRGSLE